MTNMKTTKSIIIATAILLSTVVIAQAQESPLTPAQKQQWRKALADYNYPEIAKAYARSLLAGGLEIIYKGDKASPRITYATEQVRIACEEVSTCGTLQVSVQGSDGADKLKPEGFRLTSLGDNSFSIVGADRSGVLYGCLELADRIRIAKAMPAKLDVTDAPEFKLRGPVMNGSALAG